MNAPFMDKDAPFGQEHGPLLTGMFAPIFDETVLTDFTIKGPIPTDLNGVYLRNGPNPRFKPKGMHHPFDGDGMIHAALFNNGKLTYRNRWIRTEGWQQDDRAGEDTHWGIMQTHKGHKDRPMKDTANTDVIGFGGKALATWYLSGEPYLIDPLTLETVDRADFNKAPHMSISAHPKVDEATGELMFFDYFDSPPFMRYGVVDPNGTLLHHVPIHLPGNRLPHDMGITEHYSILHDLPVYHDEEALKAGRHKIRFNAELKTRFGVIPRFGKAEDIKWFEFSPCFLYHVVNCWEEGDEVVMTACRYMPVMTESGQIDDIATAKRIANLGMDARLWRYRMNLKTGHATELCLNAEYNVEFPGYNSAYTGRYSQWAYLVDHDPNILRWTGLRKFDTDTGTCVASWSDSHEHCWYSEPWFAPRDGSTSEDDGYVILFRWHDKHREQELQVFDAQKIEAGPVARIEIPHRIPVGFHGCWMKPEQIAGWESRAEI